MENRGNGRECNIPFNKTPEGWFIVVRKRERGLNDTSMLTVILLHSTLDLREGKKHKADGLYKFLLSVRPLLLGHHCHQSPLFSELVQCFLGFFPLT